MSWFTDGFDELTDKLNREECKDGTSRYFLKDLRHLPLIFDQIFAEWKSKINAGVKIAQGIVEANVGSEVGKKAQKTRDEISNMDRNAFVKYAIAYNTYVTNPCENSKFLADISTVIINQIDKLDAQINELKTVTEVSPLLGIDDSKTDPRAKTLDSISKEIFDIHGSFV